MSKRDKTKARPVGHTVGAMHAKGSLSVDVSLRDANGQFDPDDAVYSHSSLDGHGFLWRPSDSVHLTPGTQYRDARPPSDEGETRQRTKRRK